MEIFKGSYNMIWLKILMCLVCMWSVQSVEFTFDLSDGAEDCFYEEIDKNVTTYLEFQVIEGGQMDVDVTLKDPLGHIIYELEKATYDNHQFYAETPGVYQVCISNKFSAFSHKIVYIEFQVGEEPGLPGVDDHATVLTQMETSSQSLHKSLNDILDAQTHYRLREAHGRKRAEELNERVMWWSCAETGAILFIGIGQILVLRNFFSDRKPSQAIYNRL